MDHIDGNKKNNSAENLRWATISENLCNRGKHKNNKSGMKGVSPHKGRWQAKITKDGKQTHLGIFNTAEEASVAYAIAAAELHGGFARL